MPYNKANTILIDITVDEDKLFCLKLKENQMEFIFFLLLFGYFGLCHLILSERSEKKKGQKEKKERAKKNNKRSVVLQNFHFAFIGL